MARIMAGNVYSSYELAKIMAEERMKELETDIFICRSKFKSGEEFILRPRSEMAECNSYLHVIQLPFNFRFRDKLHALRESKVFEQKTGKPVMIERHTYEENGYNKFSHFQLCSI